MTYGQDRSYKKVEVIGVSKRGLQDAIEVAVKKARNSLDQLSWFEVQDIRGHISPEGEIAEYQVVVKVAFQLK
ncbi:MAG: dodecin domain-containing protein [Desulfuromonadales bacterium]|nr:dodecin domain-containing protein [Desulfuromonadales bacterium]NIR34307.1 dodecin domain-containing protein [Desulfuromonadales bacterium]NIS44282.1 dodecin domain-containing protein [Desulfuromonadales bacterium]